MPRSKKVHVDQDGLREAELRVWGSADGAVHAILDGRVTDADDQLWEVDVRWDVDPTDEMWHAAVQAVRDNDDAAALHVARTMAAEALSVGGGGSPT